MIVKMMNQEKKRMNWSMQAHKHLSDEHLHKPDKKRLGQNLEKDYLPLQKGIQIKRCSCLHR